MTDVTLPDGTIASFPDGMAPADISAAIQNHLAGNAPPKVYYNDAGQPFTLTGQPVPQSPPAQQPSWSGRILPFSTNVQGQTQFDPNAGILGAVGRAISAPSDVMSGKVPVFQGEHISPEMNQRAAEMAALISPPAASLRAGEQIIPGEAVSPRMTRSAPVPTASELKTAASAGYDTARNSGVEVQGSAVAGLGNTIRAGLEQDGIIGELAPKTFSVIGKIENPPQGGFATIANLDAIRRSLGHVKGDPTEELAARTAIRAIDDFMGSLDPSSLMVGAAAPEEVAAVASTLRDARGNYAAAMRSNNLTGELDRAATGITERAQNRAQAANSGLNLDNSIRQQVRAILERPREIAGYSNPELEALNNVLKGSLARNTVRYMGNALGGGGGVVGSGIGAGVGAAVGGTPGAVIGAAVPTVVGGAFKRLGNAMARRSLNQANETVLMNSPLYRQRLIEQLSAIPGLDRNSALYRALLTTAMPQPQSQP